MHELLTDNLKPFTAYMSGRIEIDGDLQDVFKLKKLISSVSAVIASMNNKWSLFLALNCTSGDNHSLFS